MSGFLVVLFAVSIIANIVLGFGWYLAHGLILAIFEDHPEIKAQFNEAMRSLKNIKR